MLRNVRPGAAHVGGLQGGIYWQWVTLPFRAHFPLAQHRDLREIRSHLAGTDIVLKLGVFR